MNIRIGDQVRVAVAPHGLDPETAEIFAHRIGRAFQIVGFENGLAELHVGEAFDQSPYLRSLWTEPRLLTEVDAPADRKTKG